MAPTIEDYQRQTAYLRQQTETLKQHIARLKATRQQGNVANTHNSRTSYGAANDREFQMPSESFWAGTTNDPFALTEEEERLLGNFGRSAFSGMNSALGFPPGTGFDAHTTAEDLFGPNYEDQIGVGGIATSPFDPNYKSTSELWMEGQMQSSEGQDFMRDVKLLTASTSTGQPHNVFGTDTNGNPIKEDVDLSPKQIKEIYLKAYADAQARKAMGLG